jgi:BCL2-related ovarian killer protein
MHSRLYTNVARQISKVPGADTQTPESGPILLAAVARTILKDKVNWGKIVSLFAICAGLSVDLVRQGHNEHLPKLIDGFGDMIEDELIGFVSESGGWVKVYWFPFQ